jgi:bacillithiol biosynthesis cysteine-adding enzyme BshC
MQRQLERRGAPDEARQAAALLEDPASVAIVTGQQAGLFGGPLYTLLKAVTAIQLARRVRDEFATPAVALFWVDEEDHDWAEIRSADVLDADLGPRTITVADIPGAGTQPVSRLVLDAGIETALTELEQALGPTEFTREIMDELRKSYRPGAGVSAAFASWLDRLLGHRGLVVFESADLSAKSQVADLFARELGQPGRTAQLARAAADEMRRLGHQPQVEPAEDSVAAFLVTDKGRHAIKRAGDQCTIGDETHPCSTLSEQARTSPEQFSPNVLLRPLVQDRLFPTVCYVSGPAELAYQAQLRDVYREFGVEAPLLYSRASATLLDSPSARFLDRSGLPLEALQVQDDSIFNKLLESQLPPTIENALTDTGQEIARRAEVLKKEVAALDPTLRGAVDSTAERMQDVLKTLHHKIIQATKRKDETLRRQFQRTRSLAFPNGHPQERAVNVVFVLNRYGTGIVDRLIDALPLDTGKHYVLTI